jgi:hypothetical protein
VLASLDFLNHNNCTDKRHGANEMQAIKTDDSVTTCDCCGRSGLKFTVLMSNGAHYGSVCATKHAGKTFTELSAEMKASEAARIEAAKSEYRAHPAYAALLEKMAQRPRAMLGKLAADFVRAESDAELTARRDIAAKHGVRPYQL